jgi:hypothetical protein
MKKTRTDQEIDCLELKRRAQEQILERTQGMSPQEEVEYFRRAAETGTLADVWKSLQVDVLAQPRSEGAD